MCLGAFETPESCRQWKDEFELTCPVVPDSEGALFRRFTNGWVPCNILIGLDGKVAFAENEFNEAGYSAAIAALYEAPTTTRSVSDHVERRRRGPASSVRRAATIVILGGGVGGLVAAHHLRRRLSRAHRIVVIDRSSHHLFSSSLLWLMVGRRREDQIRRPLERLAGKGIEFHQGEIEELSLDDRFVRTHAQRFDFDYLIVSLGAELAPESVAGFAEMAHNLYDLEGSRQIRTVLTTFEGGTIGILIPAMPFKCPAAPYEAAFLVEAWCRRQGVRDKTAIHLFTPEHQPMPVAGPVLGHRIAELLRMRGIHYHPLYTFKELRPHTREVVSADGRAERVDVLLGVPPHRAPDVIRSSGLLGVSGWIHVDPHTLRTGHEGVFAIGDVTSIRLPDGKALPKAGVFAHAEATVVAEQIAAEIEGRQSHASFDGKGYCWIELGDGRAGFASGRFYASPTPQVRMFTPGHMWHWGKVAFEKWWLHHWF